MDVSKLFKIDVWWKLLLLCGIALFAAGIAFPNISVVNPKHLIGIGIGFFAIGFSCFKANRHINVFIYGDMASTEKEIHTPVTRIIYWAGVLITILFSVLLIISLI